MVTSDSLDSMLESIFSMMEVSSSFPSLSSLEKKLGVKFSSFFPSEEKIWEALFYRMQRRFEAQKSVIFKDPQELFFEKILSYFDLLEPFKKGFTVLYNHKKFHPLFCAAFLTHLYEILSFALKDLETPLEGNKKQLFLLMKTPLFASIFPIWIQDHSADLGATMATLQERVGKKPMCLHQK